ncbi:hypothetical protein, partial [Pseudomonas syringae]
NVFYLPVLFTHHTFLKVPVSAHGLLADIPTCLTLLFGDFPDGQTLAARYCHFADLPQRLFRVSR